jgi:hypothetical protein
MNQESQLFGVGAKDRRWYFSQCREDNVALLYCAKCRENTGRVLKSWTIALHPSAVASPRFIGTTEDRDIVGLDVSGKEAGVWILDGDSFYWSASAVLPHWVSEGTVTILQGEVALSRFQEGRLVPLRELPEFCDLWSRLRIPPAQTAKYALVQGGRWYLDRRGLWLIKTGNVTFFPGLGEPPQATVQLPSRTLIHQGGDGEVYAEVPSGQETAVRYLNRQVVIYYDAADCNGRGSDDVGNDDPLRTVGNHGVVHLSSGFLVAVRALGDLYAELCENSRDSAAKVVSPETAENQGEENCERQPLLRRVVKR